MVPVLGTSLLYFQVDLLAASARKNLERFLEPDTRALISDLHGVEGVFGQRSGESSTTTLNLTYLLYCTYLMSSYGISTNWYTDKMNNDIIANDKTINDKMSNGQNA